MAKVILSNPTSGKVGSQIYSHNKGGAYIKALRIPTNPRTAAQMLARTNLAVASKQWRNLPDATKAAWSEYAANNPIPDRLGQMIIVSGSVFYTRASANLLAAGISTPPSEVWDPSVVSPQGFSISSNVVDEIQITLDNGATASDTAILLRAFISSSNGVSSPGRFKQVLVILPAATGVITIADAVKGVFGDLVAANNTLWLESVQVSTTTGSASSVYRSEAVVLAA